MDIYNTAEVQKVWQRVGIAAAPEPAQQELLQLIRQEQELCCQYRYFACRIPVFRCMAKQAAEHVRKLRAVYFVLTGEQATVPGHPAERPCLDAAFLRRKLAQLSAIAQAYRQAVSAWGYGDVFSQLACEQERHSQILLNLLACRL